MSRDLIADIMQAASDVYSVPIEAITGPSRCAYLVRARAAAMIAARTTRKYSYTKIGWRFNRHYSTIIHAWDKGEADPVLRREAYALIAAVRERRQQETHAAVEKWTREKLRP